MQNIKYPIRAWTIWLLSALFMFYKSALEVSPGVMTASLMQTFEIGGMELGTLASAYFYAYLLLQIPAGFLLDSFGPRRMTTFAIALCAFGTLIFARSDTLFIAGIGRFIMGAGASFAAVNCMKLISNWFPFRQFALMSGLMMTMAMLGAVGGEAPLVMLIRTVEWRTAMEWMALGGAFLALLFCIIVRDRAPDHPKEKERLYLSFSKSIKQIVKSSQSWWLALYSGFAFAPVMIFGGLWGVSFIRQGFTLSQHTAAQVVSLVFIGFAIGAPLFGWFSDRLGKRRIVMFWGTSFALIMVTIVIYAPSLSLLSLAGLLFFFGFFISSFLLSFTIIREISLPLLAGAAIGFMNGFDGLIGAFSDPLTGKFLDLQWQGTLDEGVRIFSVTAYKNVFLTLPLYLLFSLFSLLKVKETYCKASYPIV